MTNEGRLLATCIADRGLIFLIYNGMLQINKKKWAKAMSRQEIQIYKYTLSLTQRKMKMKTKHRYQCFLSDWKIFFKMMTCCVCCWGCWEMVTRIRADRQVIRSVPVKHSLAVTVRPSLVYSFAVTIPFLGPYRETPAMVDSGMSHKLLMWWQCW